MTRLPKKTYCTLCEDDGAYVPSDSRKFEYAKMSQHIQPGVQGVTTKGAYQRLLKRHGLTDDVTTKELMQVTCDTSKRARVREERIRSYLCQMTPQFQQKAARLFRP